MSVSEQLSESGTTEETTQTTQETVGLQRLGELLAADDAQPSTDKPSGDDAGDKSSGSIGKTKPTKFNELAGAADLDLDALYKLEVQIEGAEKPVTIEALKDHFKSANDFDLRVLEFEEKRTSETNELVRAKTELQEILQSLPANAVKPDVLAKIRQKTEAAVTRERAATLEAIPDWKDADKRTGDLAAMSEHLQDYGFPMNQLESLVDHRWQRYIRDNMLRERRVKAALAKVRPGAPVKSGKAPTTGKAPVKGQSVSKSRAGMSKLEATLSQIE